MKTKHIFLVLLFILGSKNIFAQQSPDKPYPLSVRERMQAKLREVIAQDRSLFPVKKTRTSSRLIAWTNRTFTAPVFDITDSFRYAYTGNYGYDPTSEIFNFDYVNTYLNYNQNNLFDSSDHYVAMGGPLSLADSTVNIFGANHKLQDNFTDYFTYGVQETYSYQYNAGEKKILELDSIDDNGGLDKFKYVFAYNGNGKAIELRGFMWNAGVWEEQELDSLFYDGSGNLVTVKIFVYDIPNAVWVIDGVVDYTYNGANKVVLELTQIWDGVAWNNDYKTENIYDAGNRVLSVTSSYWDTGAWKYDFKDSMVYLAGSYPVSRLGIYWDDLTNSWVNNNRNDYTYNAANQVETVLSHQWNEVGNIWDTSGNATFYYQDFTLESVTATNTLSADIILYPVPSDDILNVQVSLSEKQKTEIIILDMTGKPVLKNILNTGAQYHEKLNIASLPSGNYILLLKGEKGTISRKFCK